ncbi:hypothetical protein Pfo_020753 [Paulownia fortunei]|nr:hypothetical protein Pfo_020753 [Paulownia fortunei]
MAAYAALVSLMNTMEQIQNHRSHSKFLDEKQIESLREKVGFLQDFIEGNDHGGSREAEVLERQIASAAYEAEDVIESHVVDQIHAESTGNSNSISLLDLQKVIEKMDAIKEKAMKVNEKRGSKDAQPKDSMECLDFIKEKVTKLTSSRTLPVGNNTMVGFDDYLIQLMDGLTGQQCDRLIIPIVGMGGIGKTTLARNVYENLVIVQNFDFLAWVTISHNYSVREILLGLLSCQRKQVSNEDLEASTTETEDRLGVKLYKSLSCRRYLIILDDIWSVEVWDKIKFFFPENNNRSRIVVTTRLSNVAIHFGSSCFVMNFLDEDKSWKLFCEKAFAEEGCPPELEKIGKKIAKKCNGLPLAIVVIGGLLRKSHRTQEHWKSFAKSINSILNSGEDEHCLNILSLSYSYLPAHLKPCFLYMGIFPEDHRIRVSRLIKLWVAEGFLKPNETQSLENLAEGYLKDLVDRNLILVYRRGSNGKIKSCNIHDLLRDLCLREAKKEKFLCVMRVLDIPRGIDGERRIVFPERDDLITYHPLVFPASRSTPLARSLIWKWIPLLLHCRLLRVLDTIGSYSLETIFEQVNLRFLAYEPKYYIIRLPSSISLLWNVQTLILRAAFERISAPSEIWEMRQLRHIEFYEICLPDPPSDQVDQQDDFVLLNLQTLLKVVNFRLSEEVCKRIPNVKKLHIKYDDFSVECEASSYYCLYNLGRLHELESLNCYFGKQTNRDDFLQYLRFPSSLEKLTLNDCRLHWEDLTIIGSLPHLKVLKLERNSVIGPEWNSVEGNFLRLTFLKIYCCYDLIHWNADSSCFPVLENLVLNRLFKLDEIPSGIGEIPTLGLIHLHYCSESAAISALRILEEQESFGNVGLHVRVEFWDKEELQSFREKVEPESLTSKKFQFRANL